jgi:hypothetical protein
MNLDEIVCEVIERDGGRMILDLAAEGICQSRIAAKAHADAEILAFHKWD